MDVLRELGYEYRGTPAKLLQVGKDEGFAFRDQAHYDKLADAVLSHVESLLVSEGQLQKELVPFGAEDGPRSPIYVSSGFERAEKVLLLIQGSGRVRVGVWGCALCINKDLDQGSMVPYVRKAAEAGYGVIVLNPNLNAIDGIPVPGSESPSEHVAYVWEKVVLDRCAAGVPVDIVAHSNGGRALLDFLGEHEDAAGRINRVVFTDSYHRKEQVDALSPAALAVLQRAVNFVPHASAFGTPVTEWMSLGHSFDKSRKCCECLSAAVEDHAATNHASLEAAFAFLSSADQ